MFSQERYEKALQKAWTMTRDQLREELGITSQMRGNTQFSKQRLATLWAERETTTTPAQQVRKNCKKLFSGESQ